MSMAEKSIFWTTGATGDGATAYTQAEVIRWMRQMWLADDTEEGVQKGYENDLEPTGAATPVAIDTGAAIIYGFPYWNTASVNVAIATPAGNTRIDRIVLRAGWAAQTVRITLIGGAEGAGVPPAITQTDGVTWDLKICQVSITTGGVITLTDERDWVRPNIGVDENMLDASVAGDALTGGDGNVLDVIAGTSLEISSDTIRLAAAAAGNGLGGGGASALLVNVDGTTIEISADTLQLKASGHGPSEHANRTRIIMFPIVAHVQTGTVSSRTGTLGWFALSAASTFILVMEPFRVPQDYVSGGTIKLVLDCASPQAGNLYGGWDVRWGKNAEQMGVHSHTDAYYAQAVDDSAAVGSDGEVNEVYSRDLSAVATIEKADYIQITWIGDPSDVLYTAGNIIYFQGAIFEYTADQ